MPSSVYLQPGEWIFAVEPTVIETVLGSCVGVVMRSNLGATCVAHCMLPRSESPTASDGAFRYVDRCIPRMLQEFALRNVARRTIEAKLFGGANILPVRGRRFPRESVGQANVGAALEILRREGIHISACEVGGRHGRKVVVDTATGDVFVRALAHHRAGPHWGRAERS